MRTISAAGLAKLAQTHGTEPVLLLEVDWADGISPKWYGDRDIDLDTPGKIIELGGLDNAVGISDNTTSQQIEVVLDDTDGSIKTIFDTHDIHKRTARVYQWFDGLDLTDKFLLFAGKISSPITWSEHDRTVKFTIISQLEDKEVGFSPEEGQFTWLPATMVGRPWPVIFGTVLDCPALQINEAVSGATLAGVGCLAGVASAAGIPLFKTGSNIDTSIGVSLALISAQLSVLNCAAYCNGYGNDNEAGRIILDQINELYRQMAQIVTSAAAKAACTEAQRTNQLADAENRGLGANPLPILGGEDFPQDQTLTLEINGAQFTGYFSGANFYISSRYWPDGEAEANTQADNKNEGCGELPPENIDYDYSYDVACTCRAASVENCKCRSYGYVIPAGSSDRASDISSTAVMQQFWAEPGATVRISSNEPTTYIVSIIPGTVLAVKAYKEFPGERRLVDVPSEYYTVSNVTYGAISTVQITTIRPLSSYFEQGWTDDLYVTFQSSVGPDIIDILIYLIEHYTDLTYDTVSFEYVRTKLTPFPANFPILDRKNTVEVLQDIAFQARCALWLNNGKFYIQYLPEEPASVDTITESDIDAETGIETELTATEDIVTKMKITWRMSWSPGQTDREKDKSEKTIILRHNVKRYGVVEEEYDFYIYNQPDTIYKASTFWLIRKSSTWKRIRFSTFLNKLNLETFDCVTLDFDQSFISTGAIKVLVEEAVYNSNSNQIDFTCLVPIRAGQMTKYNWFWPAGLPIWLTWPPPDEIASGDAGGDGEGMGATGTLPIGYFENWGGGDVVIVGGPNVVFTQHSDWGDRHPTDVGYNAQSIGVLPNYAEVQHTVKPNLNLDLILASPSKPVYPPNLPGHIILDLHKTRIVDSKGEQPDRWTTLSSFFRGINEEGFLTVDRVKARVADASQVEGQPLSDVLKNGVDYLSIRSDVSIWDQEHSDQDIMFDFEYDEEGDIFGAGTAFLG